MPQKVHRQAAELLLASMYPDGDGYRSSFSFGRPGSPHWAMTYGTDIVYRRRELIRAVLFVRKHGAAYLRFLSVSDIWSMLTSLISANYWHFMDEAFGKRFQTSYAEHVSESVKEGIADVLAASALFAPANELTVFPLVPIRVSANFDSDTFFLIAPEALVDPRYTAGDLTPCFSSTCE